MRSAGYIQKLTSNPSRLEEEIDRMLLRTKEDIIGEKELNKVRIDDCTEPLVRLTDYIEEVIIAMTPSRCRYDDETLYARESVAKQLVRVAREMTPRKLKIYDAFRPIEYQQKLFEAVFDKIQLENPEWEKQRVREETFIYVFPPSWDEQTPPPHSTGAAIDLTVTDAAGKELNMGTQYCEFDNPLLYTNASGLTKQQKANRRFLITSMASQGFVNYPGEWWHFSLGDREWIAYLGETTLPAIFGRADDPYKQRK